MIIPSLESDSFDYDVLARATNTIKGVEGFTCEIGVRMGGGSSVIIQSCIDNNDKRIHIGIDPYGNINYVDSDVACKRLDYTNDMKMKALEIIYRWCNEKKAEFLFFNMEDTEFFNRFSDGIPVYNQEKTIINSYALVHFDGPHSVACLKKEVEFFSTRTPVGGAWVFDDVGTYNHGQIEEVLIPLNFKKAEVGEKGRKISYIRI